MHFMDQSLYNAPDASLRPGGHFRWLVMQEGTRQTYAVPLSFQRLGQLRLMYTDVWCWWGREWLKRGPAGARALATRFDPLIPADRVIAFNAHAILDRAINHFRRGYLTPEQHAAKFIDYGTWLAKRVRQHLSGLELDSERDIFFGFDTNCLETLEYLKSRNIFTVVDQIDPGKVEEDMVVEEAARWTGWTKLPGRLPEAYWERLRAEWAIADLILVNSEWSKRAIIAQGVPADRIIVVPVCIDLHHWSPGLPIQARGPLKVLWLGSINLRKGIQYLVEAARLLQHESIEFLLAGPLNVADKVVKTFPSNIKLLGRITRDLTDQVYKQAHVFVLPTISDGFAITQLEAMAHGLPVVTTPNCGDVITDGVDGFIVPARDGTALAGALSRLNQDRALLEQMSAKVLEKIRHYDLPQNALLINRLVADYRSRITSEQNPKP
jgi:glycosyltransferase involved in cell wall biosynthesis